jgi:hypothetical protein
MNKVHVGHSTDALTALDVIFTRRSVRLSAPDVRRELAIPDGYEVVAPIVVGVPADVTSVAVRKDPEILSWT